MTAPGRNRHRENNGQIMKQGIPWNRFLVEAAVIVASILLAFAIDAWWDRQRDESQRHDLLLQLEASLVDHINQTEIAIAGGSTSFERLQTFILSSPERLELISNEDAYRIAEALWRPGGLQQGLLDSRSIIATLNTNSLTLATNPDLLSALRDWQGELETLEERNNDVLTSTKETVEAMSFLPEMQQLFATPTEARVVTGSAVRKLRDSENVMQRAGVKANFVNPQLMFLERVLSKANAALELVRSYSASI